MGLEIKETEIAGTRYEVTQLGVKAGQRVIRRLAKVVLPLMVMAQEGGKGLSDIGGLLDHLSDEDVDYLCDTFAATTKMRAAAGGELTPLTKVYEVHFAGKYIELFQWLRFCVEVNFGSFLDVLKLSAGTTPTR